MPEKKVTKKAVSKKTTKKVPKKVPKKAAKSPKVGARTPVKATKTKKASPKPVEGTKPAVKKKVRSPRRKASPVVAKHSVSAAERHAMIEVAAYYRALERGGAIGAAESDWFAAEAQIDAKLRAAGAALRV